MSAAFSIAALATVGAANVAYNMGVVARARARCSAGRAALHAVVVDGGAAFVSKHLAHDDAATAVLAVQTLRNTVLVAIFIGGIAFQAFQVAAGAAGAASAAGDAVEAARTLVLAAFLLGSFLNFALVIRAASHLAYIMGGARHAVAGDALEEGRGAAPTAAASAPYSRAATLLCGALMRALTLHFSLGFRCLYSSVPFTFAAAGPVALVVSGGLMLAFAVYADFAFAFHADVHALE